MAVWMAFIGACLVSYSSLATGTWVCWNVGQRPSWETQTPNVKYKNLKIHDYRAGIYEYNITYAVQYNNNNPIYLSNNSIVFHIKHLYAADFIYLLVIYKTVSQIQSDCLMKHFYILQVSVYCST